MEEVIVDVALLVVAARLLDEFLGRVSVPSFVSYVLAGFLLGPSVLGLVSYGEGLRVLGELALFFLVLYAGLEISYAEFLRSGLKSTIVAFTSFTITFSIAFMAGFLLDLSLLESIAIGLILSVTALPVAAAVLSELGLLDTRIGVLTMGSSVAIDIVVVAALGILIGFSTTGSLSFKTLAGMLGGVTLLILIAASAHNILVRLSASIPRLSVLLKSSEAGLAVMLSAALGLGVLSEMIGLHFIIGVFLVGLLVDESWLGRERYRKAVEAIRGVTLSLLLPLFASIIGLLASTAGISSLAGMYSLMLTLAFTIIVLIVKYSAGYTGARLAGLTWVESRLLGITSTLKGAMDSVALLIAYQIGLISMQTLIPLIVALITAAIIAPITLKAMLHLTPKEAILLITSDKNIKVYEL